MKIIFPAKNQVITWGRFFKILGQSELCHNLFTTVKMP
jgi:hypothetical protein